MSSGCGSVDLVGEFFGLMFLAERIDQFLDVAVHHGVQLVERQIDAVIRHPALREVVGADTLGPVARSPLQLARLRLFALLLFALTRQPTGETLSGSQ